MWDWRNGAAWLKPCVTDGQNPRDQITRVEGRNTGNQIAFFAFHSFLVEVQANAEYIHVTSAVASMLQIAFPRD